MAGFLSGRNTLRNESWSVTDLTEYIKELFDIDYRLRDVRVVGELSNVSQYRSGHLYFTLKDSKAQLKGVMWKSNVAQLSFTPREGDAVLISGKVSVYVNGGAYQLYAERMSPAGRGDLALAFEQLKYKFTT